MNATTSLLRTTALTLIATAGISGAAVTYVGGAANRVGIVDQHPMIRGDAAPARLDTDPLATGIYNRNVDVIGGRYDVRADYWNNTNAATRLTSLINGGQWCAPTSGLSLVRYWAANGYPDLIPRGSSDRSIIRELAEDMDTDDLWNKGGGDAAEAHIASRDPDIESGLRAYFNRYYNGRFRVIRMNIDTTVAIQRDRLAAAYKASIDNNIPNILCVPGHATVGIGYDGGAAFGSLDWFRLNDPWRARADITANQLGMGRPDMATGGIRVRGGLAGELYGPSAEYYNETSPPMAVDMFMYVTPVPAPGVLALLGAGALCITRRRR